MSVRNRRTGRWECYDSFYGDMVDCHREDEKPENYIDALKRARKYCGACDASDCDHLIAGGVHYERLGHDLVNRPAFTDHEIEGGEEVEEVEVEEVEEVEVEEVEVKEKAPMY